MSLRSVLIGATCVAIATVTSDLATAQARAPLEGAWRGYWIRAGDSLPVILTIRRSDDQYSAVFSSERLRVSHIPFQDVRVTGCCELRMTLRGDATTTEFAGRVTGDSLTGTFQERGTQGRFAFQWMIREVELYEEREASFKNGSVNLAGTLVLPRGATGPVRAVAFLHGSGAEGRWASSFLAGQLADRGIASLIYDKRGVGGSTGDWRTASPDDLATDAVAAVEWLSQRPEIDPKRIGIHGHSQGGTLAPKVAARSKRVAFVVASAAAGLPPDSVERFSVLNFILPNARNAADTIDAARYVNALVDVAYLGGPRDELDRLSTEFRGRPWYFAPPPPEDEYWKFSRVLASYRPLDWWARVRVPVLLIAGARDERVPAEQSVTRIAGTLKAAGNGDVTIRIVPGADHTFRLPPGPGGWPRTAPEYLPDLLGWLAKR